jgi:hypothetical protein
MNDLNHAIVWIDHSEAKVCRFGATDDSEVEVHSHTSLQRLHHRQGGWEAGGNPPDDGESSCVSSQRWVTSRASS